jgi:hypothetical protein
MLFIHTERVIERKRQKEADQVEDDEEDDDEDYIDID